MPKKIILFLSIFFIIIIIFSVGSTNFFSKNEINFEPSTIDVNQSHYAQFDMCMKSTTEGDIASCALEFYAIKYYCSNPELHFEACDDPRIEEFLDSKTLTALGRTMTAREYVGEFVRNFSDSLSGCLAPEAINPNSEFFSPELQEACDMVTQELIKTCDIHRIEICTDERLVEYKKIKNWN